MAEEEAGVEVEAGTGEEEEDGEEDIVIGAEDIVDLDIGLIGTDTRATGLGTTITRTFQRNQLYEMSLFPEAEAEVV